MKRSDDMCCTFEWLNNLFVSLADLYAFLCCKGAVDPSPFIFSFIFEYLVFENIVVFFSFVMKRNCSYLKCNKYVDPA